MTRLPILSRPPEWRQDALKGWYTTAMIVAAMAFLGLALLVTLLRRNLVAAVVLGILIAVVLPIYQSSRPHRPSGAPELTTVDAGDGQGTVPALRFPIPPLSRIVGACLLLLGLALVGLGVGAVVIAVRDREWAMIIGFVMLGGLGSVFLAGGIAHLLRARHELGVYLTRDHLVLSPEGERVALPWDAITEIRPFSFRFGVSLLPRPEQHWIAVAVTDRSAVPGLRPRAGTMAGQAAKALSGDVAAAFPVRRVDTDPLLLFHTLRHYLGHPRDRVELGGEEALQRIRAHRI